ncbi:MAG TPA: iron ABC transporter permease [Methylomusa anaerophila]|uniref:Hemin transport system permease protein HmuU n=1 Tax=Methylomusa anaerophila TaxID=1930071 RepID=A0A348AIV9_9FIRM|nr:iron ABC transporter permease [Methylomusa anaerophila]BBB91007.1 hemin transport system permease protein HmuU [Methylomusa anaerophila]HML88878.1 iron ABC transporter permease [Methylomusa anaerophila]
MNEKANILAQEIVRKQRQALTIGLVLTLAALGLAIASVTFGRADISVVDVATIIFGKLTGNQEIYSHLAGAQSAIVWDIRLPRIICALAVGGGLAVAGVVFQALLMNPLADSYTMGVSTGAAFGASIAIYLNIFAHDNLPVTIFAFAGAVLTLLVVMSIARVGGYVSSANLVIAGIIVSSILSAAISMIKSLAGEQVSAIVAWLIGSLAAKNWEHVLYGFPLIFIACFICFYYAEDLNILSLGDREARNLGIDSSKLRNILLAAGALITAVCVAIGGIIGFVGLIVPHMLRMTAGSDNRVLIPLCGLTGGILLLTADTFGRSATNVEIPVGVLTTLLGGPFFVYIFRKRNKTLQ